jgi:two-component system, LytTR family, sensor kinase
VNRLHIPLRPPYRGVSTEVIIGRQDPIGNGLRTTGGASVVSGSVRVISCAPCSTRHGEPRLPMQQPDTMRTSRVVGLALVVGTFFVAQEALTDLASGRPIRVADDIEVVLRFWVVWALLTPVVLMAVRRWPLDARPVYRPVVVHLVVAAVLASAETAVTLSLRPIMLVLSGTLGFRAALRQIGSLEAFIWGVFTGGFFYAVVVMVYTALRFRTLYLAEQLSAAELATRSAALEAELTRSKLDTLRSQLRPHFLFNTLNAISVFVTEDADKAREMILRLSTLLRRSLDEEAHEVALRQEMAFVNDYLAIQRGRFGDQLTVRLAVDPGVLDASVPVFLLQPLLENAIEHGKGEDNRTTIALFARREDDSLCVMLEDHGRGVGDGARVREGIGLRNTRARLHHLYGARASVRLGSANGSAASAGARVEIRIPFRETPR